MYKVKKMIKGLLTSLLLSNVIDADHQHSCFFLLQTKAIFHHVF